MRVKSFKLHLHSSTFVPVLNNILRLCYKVIWPVFHEYDMFFPMKTNDSRGQVGIQYVIIIRQKHAILFAIAPPIKVGIGVVEK